MQEYTKYLRSADLPNVIKSYGKARHVNLNGELIDREDVVFVKSEQGWFRIMDTVEHFCFRRKHGVQGSTLMCSCGSIAGIFGYEAYRQFQSTNMGRLLCCVKYVYERQHADGTIG